MTWLIDHHATLASFTGAAGPQRRWARIAADSANVLLVLAGLALWSNLDWTSMSWLWVKIVWVAAYLGLARLTLSRSLPHRARLAAFAAGVIAAAQVIGIARMRDALGWLG